jgi:hypothetical protein
MCMRMAEMMRSSAGAVACHDGPPVTTGGPSSLV